MESLKVTTLDHTNCEDLLIISNFRRLQIRYEFGRPEWRTGHSLVLIICRGRETGDFLKWIYWATSQLPE
jgi:hypothetical protein